MDRSRRPHRQHRRTAEATERLVLDERSLHPGNGPCKLQRRLQNKGHLVLPSATTFARILKRHGFINPLESQKHVAFRRFERLGPNELWQMDFKGHFALASGQRCHPLTLLDDHSRFLLCLQACADETGPTVREHLLALFHLYGLPMQILCDNGSPWGCPTSEYTSLAFWLLRQGVHVIHGRPLHPQTQGKDERFHRTLKDELLCRHDWPSMDVTQKRFDAFREDYNHHRPHQALDMLAPISRYRVSARRFVGENPPLEYDCSEITRTVKSKGEITFRNRFYYIGRAFHSHTLALRPYKRDGLYSVCLGSIALGLIDLCEPTSKPKGHYLPLLAHPHSL